MAYYTLFSLAPLLLIAITIAGFVFGREATEQQIVTTFGGLVGPQGAQAIQGLLHSASRPQSGVLGTLLGIRTLLIGAGGVISQLQDSLNLIWGVAPKPGRGLCSRWTLSCGTGSRRRKTVDSVRLAVCVKGHRRKHAGLKNTFAKYTPAVGGGNRRAYHGAGLSPRHHSVSECLYVSC